MKFEYSDAAKVRLAEVEQAELNKVVERMMAAQQQLVAGTEVLVVDEAWVRSALTCSITPSTSLMLFSLSAPDVPRGISWEKVYGRIEDLLTKIFPGGFCRLDELTGFKSHQLPGFEELILVTLESEGLKISTGGCGGSCQCHKIIGGGDGQEPGEGNEILGSATVLDKPWPVPGPVTRQEIDAIRRGTCLPDKG